MRLPSISRLSADCSPVIRQRANRLLQAAVALALAGVVAGCDSNLNPANSFLDQSELVKAKNGLIVPILDHLNQQDRGVGEQFAHASAVTADDLVVSSSDYVIGKNDLLAVSITDLVGPGIESVRQVRVTESGKISMPLVPQITAAGLTEAQLEQAIVAAYRDANLISSAQVSVTVAEARARTFTISARSAPRVNTRSFEAISNCSMHWRWRMKSPAPPASITSTSSAATTPIPAAALKQWQRRHAGQRPEHRTGSGPACTANSGTARSRAAAVDDDPGR